MEMHELATDQLAHKVNVFLGPEYMYCIIEMGYDSFLLNLSFLQICLLNLNPFKSLIESNKVVS